MASCEAADLGKHAFNERVRLPRQMVPVEKGVPCGSPTHRRQQQPVLAAILFGVREPQ
jgi:hypothetical protein